MAAVWGCSPREQYRRAEGATWGTVYHIIYQSPRDLSDSIVAVMAKVEKSLSMFDSASTVSRINAGKTDSVDSFIEAVWKVCTLVNKSSGGMFDPTVAPLTDLWGFGRGGRDVEVPDSAAVAFALEKVGFGRCSISSGTISRPEGVEFDFSAVAKGFGVDCVASMLRRNGCSDYMVEIGGEVSVAGVNPSGKPWHIQIDSPAAQDVGGESIALLELTDCAIATSGNYRNNRRVGPDSVVGHTIDPTTGYPRRISVISATVVAPSCAVADAMATACMLLDSASVAGMVGSFPSTSALLYMADGSIVRVP